MENQASVAPTNLGKIEHFIVLMLENRSFDHLLGALKSENPDIDGVTKGAFSNRQDPTASTSPETATEPASRLAMPFDPGHEFNDVQIQLYGPASGSGRKAGPRLPSAPMSGFIFSAAAAAHSASDAAMVMQYLLPAQLPVMTTLAREFAVFNYWHAPLPGPTWPNRFFVHAATSGGLSDSPSDTDILAGYSFPNGTIYKRLKEAGRSWRIYHDGLPQTAGFNELRFEFLNVFSEGFREMRYFEEDLQAKTLPDYVFIEPNYDTSQQYVNGNSMHPLNDVRAGELLIKRVYEAVRKSHFWQTTMLIVTFDEHGGFFDHVAPLKAVAPDDDMRYANPGNDFSFDCLGVRVPAIVISPYTKKNTVIGKPQSDPFDHTSILATLEKRFDLEPINRRDAAAPTLEAALNLDSPRLSPEDAPIILPPPATDSLLTRFANLFRRSAITAATPLSHHQKAQLALAHACDMQMLDAESQPAARRRYQSIKAQNSNVQKDAADYVHEVEARISAKRKQNIKQ